MTMGTASTMTAIAEALGFSLPGASSIPAADSGHRRMSAACGRRIVDMVWDALTPDRIATAPAFRNAAVVAMATGCSTNAVVHLIAMARRREIFAASTGISSRRAAWVAPVPRYERGWGWLFSQHVTRPRFAPVLRSTAAGGLVHLPRSR